MLAKFFLESFTVILTWKFIQHNGNQSISSENLDLHNIPILIFDGIPSLKYLQSNWNFIPIFTKHRKKIFDVFLTFNV